MKIAIPKERRPHGVRVAALMRDPVRRALWLSVLRLSVLRLMDEHAARRLTVLDGAILINVREADAYAAETWDFPVAAHQ